MNIAAFVAMGSAAFVALMFHHRLATSALFRTFAIKVAKFLRLGKKRNKFLCFALDFSYICRIYEGMYFLFG